ASDLHARMGHPHHQPTTLQSTDRLAQRSSADAVGTGKELLTDPAARRNLPFHYRFLQALKSPIRQCSSRCVSIRFSQLYTTSEQSNARNRVSEGHTA